VINLNAQEFKLAYHENQLREPDAIPTHLPSLNSLMHDAGGQIGFGRGWFVVWAGLPGLGKSISALSLACAALEAGETVAYVSLEMSQIQLASRYYAIASGLDVRHFGRGEEKFNARAWEIAQQKMESLPPIYLPDTISSDWSESVDFIKDAVETKGASFVVFDYLQLASCGTEQDIMRGISAITTDLRAYTVQNDIVTVCLSQFNRETAANFKLRPRASGLWGGAIIEQSADVIVALSHHAYERDEDSMGAKLWALVLKNRHGSVGDIPIYQSFKHLQQREGMEDEISAWPTP
jgi:replicative DNA helicase